MKLSKTKKYYRIHNNEVLDVKFERKEEVENEGYAIYISLNTGRRSTEPVYRYIFSYTHDGLYRELELNESEVYLDKKSAENALQISKLRTELNKKEDKNVDNSTDNCEGLKICQGTGLIYHENEFTVKRNYEEPKKCWLKRLFSQYE